MTGPSALATPYGVERIDVRTTAEMGARIAAAASSLRCADHGSGAGGLPARAPVSRRRSSAQRKASPCDLVPNGDIIAGIEGPRVKVGFAAETNDLVQNARDKIAAQGAGPDRRKRRHAPGRGVRDRHEPGDHHRRRRGHGRTTAAFKVRRRAAHPRPCPGAPRDALATQPWLPAPVLPRSVAAPRRVRPRLPRRARSSLWRRGLAPAQYGR